MLQRFDEHHTAAMKFAFERAWDAKAGDYTPGEQSDFARRMLALIILQIAASGVRDPHSICHLALRRVAPDGAGYARAERPQLRAVETAARQSSGR